MLKKISFDSLTLAAVIHEVQPLVHGRLQKIIQPDPFTIVLFIYHGNETPFLISSHPEFYRAHICTRRFATKGDQPHFATILRDHLLSGSIESITQRGLDRIIDIEVQTDRGQYRIVAELMGKHSNLIFIGPNGRILAAARPISPSQSRRPIQIGQPYSPPPFEPKPSLLKAKSTDFLQDFEGISPFLKTIIESGTPLELVQKTIQKKDFKPHFIPDVGAYSLDVKALFPQAVARNSISQALEQHFQIWVTNHAIQQQASTLISQLKRVLLAREVALSALKETLQTAKNAPKSQRLAELILAYQAQIKPQDKELKAWDFEGNEITIPLNPEMSSVENANFLFDKAKRAKDRVIENQEQFDRISEFLPLIRQTIAELESADSLDTIQRAKTLAESNNWLHHHPVSQKKEDRPYAGFSIRELSSPSGYKVLYGTNATSNDYLTTKVAKPNDIWLHVRGQTSAHVVLQTMNQPDKVQRVDLEWAAKVAVKNSVAKNASYVPVDYTLKKYVRKPRGSAPGLAIYEREKTIHIDL